jgi:hypothetical protein
MHKRWEIKTTDPEFILRIKRTISKLNEEFSVELTMTSCIDGMMRVLEFDVSEFVKTPFPEYSAGHMSKYDKDEDEVKRVLANGWMRIVGVCRWSYRNVFGSIP